MPRHQSSSGWSAISEGGYSRTELVWPGKRTQVERIALPFQVVETINQSRATRERTPLLAGLPPPPLFDGQTSPDTSWKNKLIWGENKYVLASLLQGDPSIGLEPLAGKVDLIYIDPPFATGQDFSYRARVGDQEWVKEASIIEEVAYRDTWGRGLDSYLQMMYERLTLMKELMSDKASIWVHCSEGVVAHLRLLLGDIFGDANFQNIVSWRRTYAGKTVDRKIPANVDYIIWFVKSENYEYQAMRKDLTEEDIAQFNKDDGDGRGPYATVAMQKVSGPTPGTAYDYVDKSGRVWKRPAKGWRMIQSKMRALEEDNRLYFTETTVREKYYLSERMQIGKQVDNFWGDIGNINRNKSEDLGYATQKPESLIQRIIEPCSSKGDLVADFFCGSGTTMAVAEKLGRRWIGGDLSRYAIQVSRKRLLDIPDSQPFQVLNLGRYERKYWQVHVNGSGLEPEEVMAQYQRFIVALYRAEPAEGYAHLHGQKAGRWVHVGATDAPVTRAEVMDAVRECQANRYTGLDVLGWEWEMGLHDTVRDEARRWGVDLRLLVIPREVMDKRAVQAGDVPFYELAYLKTSLLQEGRMVTVKLEDFIIPNPDLVPEEVRSKVKKWSDYIDFWAVDWNHQRDTFHNEWQTYRTRKSPTLRLVSDPHTYAEAGKYNVLVKVIDIFGNDTTQLLKVTAP